MRQDKGSFRIYVQAIAVSRLGSQLSFTALTLWAAYQFGSGVHAGILAAVPMFAGFLTSLLMGPVIDRHSPKVLMITADLLNATACFMVAICLWFKPESGFWYFAGLLVLRCLGTMASSVFEPSSQALLPLIVRPDLLMRANSRLAATKSASGVIGDSVSGILFKVLGPTGLFLIDGISYLISAAMLPFMKVQRVKRNRRPFNRHYFWHEMREGFRYILAQKGLRQILGAALIVNFLIQPIGLLLAFYIKTRLELEASWYGVLIAIFTVSNLLAAAFSAEWIAKFNLSRNKIFGFHIFLIGLSQLILFVFPHLSSAMVALFLLGLAQGPLNVMIFTAIQIQTPTEMQGRVHGTLMALFGSASPLGITVAGFVVDRLQSQIHFWFLGGFVACLLVAIRLLNAKQAGDYLTFESPGSLDSRRLAAACSEPP